MTFQRCFLETLARFRVDPKLAAELAEIEAEDDYCPAGEVPVEWIEKRIMGSATAEGEYADICSSEWISRLRKVLAVHLAKFGVEDLANAGQVLGTPCRFCPSKNRYIIEPATGSIREAYARGNLCAVLDLTWVEGLAASTRDVS